MAKSLEKYRRKDPNMQVLSAVRVRRHTTHNKALRRWRDRLIDEETALAEFAREFALRDWQALRSLVVEARKERSESRPPRRYREVFRSVREILDAAASETASKAVSDQAANASPDDVATTNH